MNGVQHSKSFQIKTMSFFTSSHKTLEKGVTHSSKSNRPRGTNKTVEIFPLAYFSLKLKPNALGRSTEAKSPNKPI